MSFPVPLPSFSYPSIPKEEVEINVFPKSTDDINPKKKYYITKQKRDESLRRYRIDLETRHKSDSAELILKHINVISENYPDRPEVYIDKRNFVYLIYDTESEISDLYAIGSLEYGEFTDYGYDSEDDNEEDENKNEGERENNEGERENNEGDKRYRDLVNNGLYFIYDDIEYSMIVDPALDLLEFSEIKDLVQKAVDLYGLKYNTPKDFTRKDTSDYLFIERKSGFVLLLFTDNSDEQRWISIGKKFTDNKLVTLIPEENIKISKFGAALFLDDLEEYCKPIEVEISEHYPKDFIKMLMSYLV